METTIIELANIENFKRFLLDLTEKADELKAELIGVESGQLDRIVEALNINAALLDMIESMEDKLK
mgnify:CR=1 FL=1